VRWSLHWWQRSLLQARPLQAREGTDLHCIGRALYQCWRHETGPGTIDTRSATAVCPWQGCNPQPELRQGRRLACAGASRLEELLERQRHRVGGRVSVLCA
jgi:hypothetical protein